MSDNFFYDLNKKLQQVADAPKSEHKQLNERDEGKHNNATTGFKALAKKAAKEYGSKAAGERVAGAVRAKMAKAGKLEEQGVEEDFGATAAIAGGAALGSALGAMKGRYDDLKHMEKDDTQIYNRQHKPRTTMQRVRAAAGFPSKNDPNVKTDEGMLDSLKNVGKKIAGGINRAVGHGSDEAMLKDLQKKMGVPPTGKKPAKPMDEEYGPMEDGALKGGQKKLDRNHNGKLDAQDFAMLRAGKGRKETDEGTDWSQLGKEYSRPKIGSVTHGHKHDIEQTATGQRVTRRTDPNTGHSVGSEDDVPAAGEKRGRGRPKGTGKSMGAKGPSGKSKLMTKEAEHDSAAVKQAIAMLKKAGYKVSKAKQELDELSPDTIASYQKKAMPQAADASNPKAGQRTAGVVRSIGRASEAEELDEKAVSKKQQKFMGMVHAAQKGEKPASKEVAKVAKTMKKSDAEDFAATKHKGLPEKKKSEGKKKEKTEEAGGTSTPTASSGFSYGKGIYDSLNRELEKMISESMSINMSDSTEGGKSLTVTATDEDALSLAAMLQNAGIGGEHEHAEVGGGNEACDTCGSQECGCEGIEEAVSENEPDWPTDEVTSDDALQYSGGLNGPKSTGQTTVPVIANQGDRTGVDDETMRRLREMAGLDEQEQVMAVEEELDEAKEMCEVCEATPCKCDESIEESLAALRGLAGIQEAAKPDYIDLDKDGDKKESMKKAADDKEAEDKKVEESIFNMTNLWKAYKG